MARVRFDDGTVINFEGNPTNDDISDAYEQAKSLKGTPGNIPKTESLLQRAMRGVETAGEVIGGGFNRAVQAGPTSFNVITGGPATEFAHGVKTEAMTRGGMPGFGAEVISTATDPQGLLLGGGLKGINTPFKSVGATVKEINPFFKSIGKLRAMEKGDTSVQEAARAGLFGNRAKLTSEFEKDLSALPKTTHDITEQVDKIGVLSEFNPSLQAQIRKSPMMQRLLKTPEIAKDITTEQFQALRNELGKGVNYKSGSMDSTVRDVLDELRWKQAEPFPEEMAALRQRYGSRIEAFKTVRPKFSKNALTGNIRDRFGNNPEVLKDLKTTLPEETFNELDTLGRHGRIGNTAYSVGKTALLSGAGAGLLKWIFGKKG